MKKVIVGPFSHEIKRYIKVYFLNIISSNNLKQNYAQYKKVEAINLEITRYHMSKEILIK